MYKKQPPLPFHTRVVDQTAPGTVGAGTSFTRSQFRPSCALSLRKGAFTSCSLPSFRTNQAGPAVFCGRKQRTAHVVTRHSSRSTAPPIIDKTDHRGNSIASRPLLLLIINVCDSCYLLLDEEDACTFAPRARFRNFFCSFPTTGVGRLKVNARCFLPTSAPNTGVALALMWAKIAGMSIVLSAF